MNNSSLIVWQEPRNFSPTYMVAVAARTALSFNPGFADSSARSKHDQAMDGLPFPPD